MASIALISDLHANVVALDAVLADIAQAGVDRIVCLGDIVDLGPEPGLIIDRLRERDIPCVQGNHDLLDERPPTLMLQRIEQWTRDQLSAAHRSFLEALPGELVIDLDGTVLRCVHGSPRSFHDSILTATPDDDIAAWAREKPFDVLACGHTHVPFTRFLGTRAVVNVGSVGMPFVAPFSGRPPDVLPFSDYAIVRTGHQRGQRVAIEHRRIPLDVAALRATFDPSFPHADEWLQQWASG